MSGSSRVSRGSPGGLRHLLYFALSSFLLFSSTLAQTTKHEAGFCAIRGECGQRGWFGKPLPCPDNGPATEPKAKLRKDLVDFCGQKWAEGAVCCTLDQLETMKSNLEVVQQILAPCPACKANFFNLVCTMTCSPNQSQFLNVTKTETISGADVVSELSYYVNPAYGRGFFDSCKNVKFSQTGGSVMEFIGGNAKNWSAFLKFLGDEKPIGSPFQINYVLNDESPKPPKPIVPMNDPIIECWDPNPAYSCSCLDCVEACPQLPPWEDEKLCHVGIVPCLSFAVIIVYAVFLTGIILCYGYFFTKTYTHRYQRLRLLHDDGPSDDEDEGDILAPAGFTDHPAEEYPLNVWLDNAFQKLGRGCARYPGLTIGSSIIVIVLMSLGWTRFQVERDPVKLWVSPTSETALQKNYFDENFGPFWRIEQAFLVNDTTGQPGPVLSYDTLKWWFNVESTVRRMKSMEEGVTLADICFNPTGNGCAIQSISGWFDEQPDLLNPTDWASHIKECAGTPSSCLPNMGQPLDPEVVLGGFQSTDDALNVPAIMVSWVVNNHPEGSKEVKRAMDWEESLKRYLLDVQAEARGRGLRLSFNTEVSLEQELNNSANTDAKIVVISYICMFIYASLALGSTGFSLPKLLGNPSRAFVDSKFTLGVAGIVIVLMSVSASVGLFSAMGVKVTLIIAEVIPFLVLAIGVDNIFLITHEFERANTSHPDRSVEDRISKALGRMGPSILLSALTETMAFALGAVVAMPAVRNFAIYAAGAVLINAVLQVTMFVSVLSLNQQRQELNRFDCFPCVVAPGGPIRQSNGEEESYLQKFIRKTYAPKLLNKYVKVTVIVIFLGFFAAGIGLMPEIELGLDQRNALPDGSYTIDYFNDLYDYFGVGPPVFFVTKDLNITDRVAQKAICGRFTTCNQFSLGNILEQERKRQETSYIAKPAANWLDDYFQWLDPRQEACCSIDKSTGFSCEPGSTGCEICFEDRTPAWNQTLYGMPEGKEFMKYLDLWLDSPVGQDCVYGGAAQYKHAVNPDYETNTIKASHFRSSHTKLASQKDFIESFSAARRIAAAIGKRINAEVFPYSMFYIFFDQYTTIVKLTETLIAGAILATFIISSILLGSFMTGLAVSVTVTMIVVDIIGIMALWGVSLNAVTLVNLVICVGIGVEFCAHIARAFMFPSRTLLEKGKKLTGKNLRSWVAMVNVGGSVFSGITITKLIGVTVLAFTKSKIFEIYYFRIWLALVIVAATHALIFLPVLLTVMGGGGYLDSDEDLGLEEDLASRQYQRHFRGTFEESSDEES
ncbi:hypothetical protein H072_4544 [Dactylellina haptotyla CBS 200.50]|uniref:SSD domain-containing protein n=1 Tax=Dactylellina haptotyla (strain CBS 200.50) TaxID=1284197 RepID=S8BPZ3_DACHA|nr:hypothetical protein H072_4544 [Dactylellina haptotyla CBS 200.50]